MAKPHPERRVSPTDNGQRRGSEEYDRFRDLTKRLVSVPKKEINGQPERKPAKKTGG
jgi:hypothetical protein